MVLANRSSRWRRDRMWWKIEWPGWEPLSLLLAADQARLRPTVSIFGPFFFSLRRRRSDLASHATRWCNSGDNRLDWAGIWLARLLQGQEHMNTVQGSQTTVAIHSSYHWGLQNDRHPGCPSDRDVPIAMVGCSIPTRSVWIRDATVVLRNPLHRARQSSADFDHSTSNQTEAVHTEVKTVEHQPNLQLLSGSSLHRCRRDTKQADRISNGGWQEKWETTSEWVKYRLHLQTSLVSSGCRLFSLVSICAVAANAFGWPSHCWNSYLYVEND